VRRSVQNLKVAPTSCYANEKTRARRTAAAGFEPWSKHLLPTRLLTKAADRLHSDRVGCHGEGVAIGCWRIGVRCFRHRLGFCSQEDSHQAACVAHLAYNGECKDDPCAISDGVCPNASHLVILMGQDKKSSNGQLRFILARVLGDAFVPGNVPPPGRRSPAFV